MAHYGLARNTALHGFEDAAKKAKSGASDGKTATDYRVEVTRLMRVAAGIFSFMAKTLLVRQRSPAPLCTGAPYRQ